MKTFFYYDFFEDKNAAIKAFLHHAKDHKEAADNLCTDPSHYESAAYLYHIAFELLLKALCLKEFEEFNDTHSLINLFNKINSLSDLTIDINLVKHIDRFFFLRYPIDQNLMENNAPLKKDRETYIMGE